MGSDELKWHQPAHQSYGASILVHTVHLKSMINAHSSGRMVSIGVSVVVFASVHSEKPI